MLQYTEKQLNTYFGNATMGRARDYAAGRRIHQFNVQNMPNGYRLQAKVQGDGRLYVTTVWAAEKNDTLELRTDCSCPVGERCKHAAALLLFYQKQQATPKLISNNTSKPNLPLDLQQWLTDISKITQESLDKQAEARSFSKRTLCYVLDYQTTASQRRITTVSLYSLSVSTEGVLDYNTITDYAPESVFKANPPQFIRQQDVAIAKELGFGGKVLEGVKALPLLKKIINTGRAYWGVLEKGNPPLVWSETLHDATFDWAVIDTKGTQKPVLNTSEAPHLITLPLDPPVYVDSQAHTVGMLKVSVPLPILARLMEAPPVAITQVEAVETRLKELSQEYGYAVPTPRPLKQESRKANSFTPCLFLQDTPIKRHAKYGWGMEDSSLATARLAWRYDDAPPIPFGEDGAITTLSTDGTLTTLRRQRTDEVAFSKMLPKNGLIRLQTVPLPNVTLQNKKSFFLPDVEKFSGDTEEAWTHFMLETVPILRKAGFEIIIAEDFSYNVQQPDEWYGDVGEGAEEAETTGIDWFDFHLGVVVDGQKVDIVAPLLKMLRRWGSDSTDFIKNVSESKTISIQQENGKRLVLPAQRVAAILRFLLSVDSGTGDDLKLNRSNAVDLVELQAALESSKMRWFENSKLRNLGVALKDNGGIPHVLLPSSINATLRPYQQDGVNWLSFLRTQGVGGILADDMGLGKTLQALSYIQLEKEVGRLQHRPVLVIAPTSLMFNWKNEAEKFCPTLKVLTLQGLDRKQHFRNIPNADVVLTTYPLLPFDKEMLLKHRFHTIFLDEAQYIKNAKAKTTLIASQLKADNRFCLTGTPLENHLGEIWSLFNFLMPGFLQDSKTFTKHYRNPIEKKQDEGTRKYLLQRVRPFLLRRTKEQVATELPPKTEIVQYCELEREQREVYEGVRLRMHEKVRAEIAERGLARSQIIVLDALLKLRQICCHPPLLKSEDTKKITASAKLEALTELIENLLQEGRRIVIFSQFVEMLKVIEKTLQKKGISYSMLTGQTKDRATVVNQFQEGQTEIFLISLKAGGVGLNLTAADTVIHYDPWWNPAAERQAADRVYRIGQDKPVFVYKLIAKDTVEEKILALQQRKQDLADSLFSEGGEAMKKLTQADVESLLAA